MEEHHEVVPQSLLLNNHGRPPVPRKEIGSNPNVCLAQTKVIGVAVVVEEGCIHAFEDGVSSKAWNCVSLEVDVLPFPSLCQQHDCGAPTSAHGSMCASMGKQVAIPSLRTFLLDV